MSESVFDPSKLTKEKLKRELSRRKIPLPPSDSRKDVYVRLYREHVLRVSKQVSEFSSDDEAVAKTPSRSPRKKSISPKKSPKKSLSKERKEEQKIDLAKLSDEELSRKLKEFGVDVGPIVDSTRRIYQKKLATLLADGVSIERPHKKAGTVKKVISVEEADRQIITQSQSVKDSIPVSDSDDDIKEIAAPAKPSKPTSVRQRPVIHTATTVINGNPDRTDYHGYRNDRDQTVPLKPVPSALNSTKVAQTSQPQKNIFSIVAQILVFLGVAVLIYFIVASMDTRPLNLIPSRA